MKFPTIISGLCLWLWGMTSYAQVDSSAKQRLVGGAEMDSQLSISENMAKTRNHTVFTAVVKAAGLQSVLSNEGPFTVFAPQSEAFIHKMPAGTVEVLFDELLPEQQPELANMMSYHIVRGQYTLKDMRTLIQAGKGEASLTTMLGKTLKLREEAAHSLLVIDENGRQARIQDADIQANNGIVHVIDEVLLPKNDFFSREGMYYPSGKKPIEVIQHHHPYHQTLVLTLGMSFAPYEGNSRRRDQGDTQVRYTVNEAMDFIKRLDNLTLGMPKIIFLVGWQYNGHDSKYPAFFEGNEALKRPEDKNALESIRWLMAEARKYHTTVSVHVNFTDAYEDSPLWDAYLANNIIGRLKGGHIRKAVGWGYPISYVQELKTGFFKKRIDSLFAILPLKEAGVIHVDAFHTYNPLDPRGPMSPYLGYTVAQEEAAQKEMFKYIATKGADVTSEFVHEFRDHGFEGYQPFAWHFRITAQEYLDWPASYYTGALDKTDLGKLFGTSFHLNGGAIKQNFYKNTAVWYFLNRFKRLSYEKNQAFQCVRFSEDVESRLTRSGDYTLKQKDALWVDKDDVFIPALWINERSIVAYSAEGYQNRTWRLPETWKGVQKVVVYAVDFDGKKQLAQLPVKHRQLRLDMQKNQALLIQAL